MDIRINDKNYQITPSFMSLVRYRSFTGVSFLKTNGNRADEIRLLHESIVGDKPPQIDFFAACENSSDFDAVFTNFYHELFVKERPTIQNNDGAGDKELDEFEVLALAVSCAIPQNLLELLNIFQLVALVSKCCDLKSGNINNGEMSAEDRKQLYGITPEKEAEIEAYLQSTAGESEEF